MRSRQAYGRQSSVSRVAGFVFSAPDASRRYRGINIGSFGGAGIPRGAPSVLGRPIHAVRESSEPDSSA